MQCPDSVEISYQKRYKADTLNNVYVE